LANRGQARSYDSANGVIGFNYSTSKSLTRISVPPVACT
jgi:hypothetical protein